MGVWNFCLNQTAKNGLCIDSVASAVSVKMQSGSKMCNICCKEKRGVRLLLYAIDIARENLSSCKHLMDIVTGL
jgi:hypothetical protein